MAGSATGSATGGHAMTAATVEASTSPIASGDAVTRLFLLDGFRLLHDGTWVNVPRNLQRVVAALGLHPCANRTHLAGLLWPEAREERAQSRLRTGLWRLGKVPGCRVVTIGGSVRLHPGISVDADDLVRVAADVAGGGDPHRALPVLAAGRDELLPGWFDDWVLLERERLRQLRLHALERVARAHALAGEFGPAVEAAFEALRAEPLRETPHRLLVQIHLAEGNAFEALQAFYNYRDLIRRELEIEPSSAMSALVDPILSPVCPRSRR